MDKKDPFALESALNELESKIPPGKVPEKEIPFIKQAQTLQEKLETQKRMFPTPDLNGLEREGWTFCSGPKLFSY